MNQNFISQNQNSDFSNFLYLAINSGHALAEIFENGFRYYVHDQNAMPYLSTEGISVSPGTKVYSAISPTNVFFI